MSKNMPEDQMQEVMYDKPTYLTQRCETLSFSMMVQFLYGPNPGQVHWWRPTFTSTYNENVSHKFPSRTNMFKNIANN